MAWHFAPIAHAGSAWPRMAARTCAFRICSATDAGKMAGRLSWGGVTIREAGRGNVPSMGFDGPADKGKNLWSFKTTKHWLLSSSTHLPDANEEVPAEACWSLASLSRSLVSWITCMRIEYKMEQSCSLFWAYHMFFPQPSYCTFLSALHSLGLQAGALRSEHNTHTCMRYLGCFASEMSIQIICCLTCLIWVPYSEEKDREPSVAC